jgi:hypothetical protein
MSRLAENLVYSGKGPFSVRPCRNEKRILKAGTVPHTSTNFLPVWKSCAGIFAANDYSQPESVPLSSAEDVTAAVKVQTPAPRIQ